MFIGVIILTFTTNLHLRFIYRDIKKLFINEPKEMKMLKKNIIVWERAAASISPFSKDANLVRETLKKKVKILRHELKKKMTKVGVETSRYKSTLEGNIKGGEKNIFFCRISTSLYFIHYIDFHYRHGKSLPNQEQRTIDQIRMLSHLYSCTFPC
jgi:hypothetical protein